MNALDDPLYRELLNQRPTPADTSDGPTARWLAAQREAERADTLRLIQGGAA